MTSATSTGRDMGRLVTVGTLALALWAVAASPAAAETRNQAVTESNTAIEGCFESGGEPDASVSSDGSIATYCYYNGGSSNGGSTLICTWEPPNWVMQCGRTNGQDTHLPVDGGGVLDGGGANQGDPVNSIPQLTPPHDHQPPTTPTSPPDQGKQGKKHRHGHHGTRH